MVLTFGGFSPAALNDNDGAWATWLSLCGIARRAATDRTWAAAVPSALVVRDGSAPLVTGTTFTVDPAAATRLVRRLLGQTHVQRAARADGIAMLDAAVAMDEARLWRLADGLGVDRGVVAALAPLLVLPLLQACRHAWEARIATTWDDAACPVCGAWTAFAEARGLEPSCRLRCARCGAGWGTATSTRCPFCGEHDRTKLSALVVEATAGTRLVALCTACRTYLKVVTTAIACPPTDVVLLDLATVDLDVAALQRGYKRPRGSRTAVGTRVIARGTGRMRARWAAQR